MVNGYETEKDVRMELGNVVSVGGYTFKFNGTTNKPGPNYKATVGDIDVLKGDTVVRKLYPEKRTYNASGMVMTEAAIDTGLVRDLYVALGEPLDGGAWVVRVYHKPFIIWIWLGCILMAFGGILAISDRRYRFNVIRKKQSEIQQTTEKEVVLAPNPSGVSIKSAIASEGKSL